jgi:hypothetical protein
MARRAGSLGRSVATGIPGNVLFGPGLIGESIAAISKSSGGSTRIISIRDAHASRTTVWRLPASCQRQSQEYARNRHASQLCRNGCIPRVHRGICNWVRRIADASTSPISVPILLRAATDTVELGSDDAGRASEIERFAERYDHDRVTPNRIPGPL